MESSWSASQPVLPPDLRLEPVHIQILPEGDKFGDGLIAAGDMTSSLEAHEPGPAAALACRRTMRRALQEG
jgi:hypothetical protein